MAQASDLGNSIEADVSVILGERENELEEGHDSDLFFQGSQIVVQSNLEGYRDKAEVLNQ